MKMRRLGKRVRKMGISPIFMNPWCTDVVSFVRRTAYSCPAVSEWKGDSRLRIGDQRSESGVMAAHSCHMIRALHTISLEHHFNISKTRVLTLRGFFLPIRVVSKFDHGSHEIRGSSTGEAFRFMLFTRSNSHWRTPGQIRECCRCRDLYRASEVTNLKWPHTTLFCRCMGNVQQWTVDYGWICWGWLYSSGVGLLPWCRFALLLLKKQNIDQI